MTGWNKLINILKNPKENTSLYDFIVNESHTLSHDEMRSLLRELVFLTNEDKYDCILESFKEYDLIDEEGDE